MRRIGMVVAVCILTGRFSASVAEETTFHSWKAIYDADGIKAVSYDDAVWLTRGTLTVFKPGWKGHWFNMQEASCSVSTGTEQAEITWKKSVSEQFAAELKLTMTRDSATWHGHFEVGVEGPVEMGILVPVERLESPGGVIHYRIARREMELYREEPFKSFSPRVPVRFDSAEWTAVFEGTSSVRAWTVQDKRAGSEPTVRFIVGFRASGEERLVANAQLSLRLQHYAEPEAEKRRVLLSQCMRKTIRVLVENPGFEEGDEPVGWRHGSNAKVVEDKVPEGKRCLRMTVENPEEKSVYVTQRVPIRPGSRYRLSGMLKAEGVKPADVIGMRTVGDVLILEWADKDGKWLASGSYSDDSFGTHGWQKRWCREVIAPDGAAYAIIYLALRGLGTAWFDDIRLVEVRPTVSLVSPIDGSTISDNRPLFTWRQDVDAREYRIGISSDRSMARDKLHVSATCAENCFRPEQPLPPGRWFWRVSRDGKHPSTVWSFEQSAPQDRDTTGPVISIESPSLESLDQPLLVIARDPSGLGDESLRLRVDDRPVEVEVSRDERWLHVTPRGGWERGGHLVTVLLADSEGNESAEDFWIAVAPPPPRKITWTRDRGVLMGEEYRFPLGIYQVSEENMPRVAKAGFDVVHMYQWEGSQDDAAARAYLDAAHRNELMAFVGFDRGHYSHNGLCQLNLGHVTRRVAALRDHPALLAWYLFDEPDLPHQYVAPPNLRRLYQHIHKLDPYHPVIVTFAVKDSPAIYPRCYDVYWTMVYRTPDYLDEKMNRDREAIGDTPLMAIVHCYDRTQTQFLRAGEPVDDAAFQPDLRILRANAYTALANGTSGLFWWYYGDGRKRFLTAADIPEAWGWLTQVVRELHALEPVLTAEGNKVDVAIEPAGLTLRCRGKQIGKKITIIAANYGEEKLEAVLSASALPQKGEAVVRFENRTVPVRHGGITDVFAPLERHVYEVELP